MSIKCETRPRLISKNISFLSNANHNDLCLITEKLDAPHASMDAHQKFEKNPVHQHPPFIQREPQYLGFQLRELGRTLCVPRTHSSNNTLFMLNLGLDAWCFVWGKLDAECASLDSHIGACPVGMRV